MVISKMLMVFYNFVWFVCYKRFNIEHFLPRIQGCGIAGIFLFSNGLLGGCGILNPKYPMKTLGQIWETWKFPHMSLLCPSPEKYTLNELVDIVGPSNSSHILFNIPCFLPYNQQNSPKGTYVPKFFFLVGIIFNTCG